jgi:3-hydroxyacyl-[acyl-carrier-protein] dehydratase
MTGFEGTVFFDPDDPLYANHFPGRPAVPGSLITDSMMTLLKEKGLSVARIRKVRFIRFAAPSRYRYAIDVEGSIVRWRLLSEQTLFAEGVFELCI